MRLTLRTLLAYLDDMLDEQDEKLLKQKIDESTYATSLVARIQSAMDHPSLGAMSPDAVGPLENANVISEYLDSTLSAEQIAEVERVCLESDTTLAEAAACHQILTMVLGQPARVSDGLKERIYTLPASEALRNMEQQIERAPDANPSKSISSAETASYSSLDIPANEKAAADASGDPTIGQDDTHAATPIAPVGPSDSGVADAPTRLRNPVGHAANPSSSRSEAELVARTTRAMMREDGYGGMVRPSRITPWLVSLALVAVLLFSLGKIFAPLIEQRIADRDTVNDDAVTTPDTSEQTPAATPSGPAPPVPGSPPTTPIPDEASAETSSEETVPSPQEDSATGDVPMTTAQTPAETTTPETDVVDTAPASTPNTSADAPDVTPAEMTDTAEVAPPKPPETLPAETAPTADATATTPPEVAEVSNVASGTEVAHLVNGQSVVLVQNPTANSAEASEEADAVKTAGWRRLWPALAEPEDESAEANPEAAPDDRLRFVGASQTVLAPSLYRPILAGDQGVEWTLAGPTRLTISHTQSVAATPSTATIEEPDAIDSEEPGDDAQPPETEPTPSVTTVTRLQDGRLLLASTRDNVTATWELGPRTIEMTMPESQTVLAIEMTHLRPLGMDPRVPGNRMPIYRVTAVQGSVQLKDQASTPIDGDAESAPEVVTLEPNQQWRGRGTGEAEVSDVERLPNWIDPPEKADLLVTSAREGLLEFVSRDGSFDDKQLEKELREAMAFRRVEVSALAAQTLLMIGRADVYFGATGILSTPRHRLYFTEHFQQLRQHMASDAEAAKAIDNAIQQAEQADGETLFELLVGYNNEQLEAGADAKLVEYLSSSSMSVRVLAIENLRDIVGDTLGYRPDQENVSRRNSDIKKWQARLRRGDIRYTAED
ncbi:putative transmembrane protein [Rhodopirellula islandica]|uniref:Transmembrane protein n=1 Tax=Rhodopirellula islandica TaxID=595434 RepID=A0A0J1EC23_RHOIS|nr:hypothetical protein [Rhodopirellula islandica]KLU03184.1 putative transmembrane protein [Rhodopirellula islandica]